MNEAAYIGRVGREANVHVQEEPSSIMVGWGGDSDRQ